MPQIKCTLQHVIFRAEDSGYSVLRVKIDGESTSQTITGLFGELTIGTILTCEGSWRNDPKHGRQFEASGYIVELPTTTVGIEKFLASGLLKGLGVKYAKAIVKKFGTETIDIIDKHPERLNEVKGLGQKRIQKLLEGWEHHRDIKHVMMFLQSYGVSTTFATRILEQYGKNCVDKVKADPYLLADEVRGLGFHTADTIARQMGIGADDIRRICAAVLYMLKRLCDDGHTYIPDDEFPELIERNTGVPSIAYKDALAALADDEKIIIDDDRIYLRNLYLAERSVAKKIKQLTLGVPPTAGKIDFKEISRQTGIDYDDVQKEAIIKAAESNIMVLTGGPGTGKTTTTQGIIAALGAGERKVLLAAPTGRAAKRLAQATHMSASTIHRMLEYSPTEGFTRNADNPLDADVLIVDECSMLDLPLMSALMRAVPPTMQVVLVGDIDQLPSVGVGNVLRDIIDSGIVPTVRLTRIFRQSQQSRIVMSAHDVNKGRMPNIGNGPDTDFFFVKCDNDAECARQIVSLVSQRLPKAYGVTTDAIQVLTAIHNGDLGDANLNKLLQGAINPGSDGLQKGNTTFRVGDRVMQTKNNYEKGIFNGDMGYITEVDYEDDTLRVDFDGNKVQLQHADLDQLSLAYCVTIHKSQGSEYPIIVVPVVPSFGIMLQRNLIYTAITRAKKYCILIGSAQALAKAIGNNSIIRRRSYLAQRLRLQN